MAQNKKRKSILQLVLCTTLQSHANDFHLQNRQLPTSLQELQSELQFCTFWRLCATPDPLRKVLYNSSELVQLALQLLSIIYYNTVVHNYHLSHHDHAMTCEPVRAFLYCTDMILLSKISNTAVFMYSIGHLQYHLLQYMYDTVFSSAQYNSQKRKKKTFET